MDDEAAVAGAAVVGRIEEAPAVQRAAEQLEVAVGRKMKRDIDAAGALELVEERLAERQAELHRAEMLAGQRDRNDAADAEPGDAAFEADDRLAVLIGCDHRLAESREVVAEFLRLVDAQIGCRRRRVKLELIDAIVGFQRCKSGAEQRHQGIAVAARHRFLHRGNGRDHGAHRRGPAGLLAEPRLQRVVVAAQLAFIGAIDDARDDPHRTQQDEDRRSCRGQRQGGGDPGPEPQMEVSGEAFPAVLAIP